MSGGGRGRPWLEALSNQKFRELTEEFGGEEGHDVGKGVVHAHSSCDEVQRREMNVKARV